MRTISKSFPLKNILIKNMEFPMGAQAEFGNFIDFIPSVK
jgi:hypothetical protein